jgi:ERCC4-type nuclease
MPQWRVDIREPAEIVALFTKLGASVEQLQVGDYSYGNVVGFERKSDDFLNYAMVLRQAGECKETYPYAYLIVEKDLEQIIAFANKHYSKPQTNQILGMVASLCVRGMTPIFCSNQKLLVQLMQLIAEKALDGKPRSTIPRELQTRKFDANSDAISVLLGFPNLGIERAKTIMMRYPSLRDALTVILSRPDELSLLPGIGAGIVQSTQSSLDSVGPERKDKPVDIFDEGA